MHRGSRSGLAWGAAFALLLLGLGALASEEAKSEAQLLADARQKVEELRQAMYRDPRKTSTWQALLSAEAMRSVLELRVERPQASVEERRAHGRRAIARVVAEWAAASPDAAAPWLQQAAHSLDGEARDRYVLEILERFPDDPDAISSAAAVLRRRGDLRAVDELLESFLRRRPDEPRAYALLVEHHVTQGRAGRAEELLGEWMASRPDDVQPLVVWLRSPLAERDPEALRPQLERLVATAPATDRHTLCSAMLRAVRGHYRAQALSCLEDLPANDGGADGDPPGASSAETASRRAS